MTTTTILDVENVPRRFPGSFCQTRPGPEKELVGAFLSDLPFSAPRGCNTTIFCEPRIESGVPDLVIVFWNQKVARRWTRERLGLTKDDIRLAHYMYQVGCISSAELQARYLRPVKPILGRLEAAGLIRSKAGMWISRPLADSFAAKRIIAIEAKMSQWTRALQQAYHNTWFASDSFILWPRQQQPAQIETAASTFGVGVCTPGGRLTFPSNHASGALPRSYVSWLFNEWAWRTSQS